MDGQTETSSLDRACIPCSAVKTIVFTMQERTSQWKRTVETWPHMRSIELLDLHNSSKQLIVAVVIFVVIHIVVVVIVTDIVDSSIAQ